MMKIILTAFLFIVALSALADNRSDQMNPNNDAYWESRGYDDRPDNWDDAYSSGYDYSQHDYDNRSNQLNPNNGAYWQSRGYKNRPNNWDDVYSSEDDYSQHDYDNRSNQLNPNNDAYLKSIKDDNRNNNWGRKSHNKISPAWHEELVKTIRLAWHFMAVR